MSQLLHSVILDDTARRVVSTILIFILVLLLGVIAKKIVNACVTATGFSVVNRLLGMVFGIARGILFNTIILVVLQASAFQNAAWVKNSVIAPSYKPLVEFFNALLPSEINKVSKWV